MKRKSFISILTVVLFFFVTCFCTAALAKKKDSEIDNSNKQSLESSTRGKDRADQRHQMREKEEIGKKSDVSDDDSMKGKEESSEAEKETESKKSGWWRIFNKSDDKNKDADDGSVKSKDDNQKDVSSESDKETEPEPEKSGWWKIFKKSEE